MPRLQGRTKFQGLDISIENRKGSIRRWYDPHGKEKGQTKMYSDYGYIRGSEGTDGDHVDVYLGPDPEATHAFIVNQMKKPADEGQHAHRMPGGGLTSYDGPGPDHTHKMPGGGQTGPYKARGNGRGDHVHETPRGDTGGEVFKPKKKWTEFDEQKVMLGFGSAKAAKAAYMRQYNDPRFFGSMKTMPMAEFKEKVLMKENHGKKVASAPVLSWVREAVKQASSGGDMTPTQEKIVERMDEAGLGILAAPYAANLVGRLRHRKGALGAVGRGAHAAEKFMHKHEAPLELAGLGLLVPSLAKGVAKRVAPAKEPAVVGQQQLAAPALAIPPSTEGAKMAQDGATPPPSPPPPPAAPQMASKVSPSPLSGGRAAALMPTPGAGAGAPAGNAVQQQTVPTGTPGPSGGAPGRKLASDLARAGQRIKKPKWELTSASAIPKAKAVRPMPGMAPKVGGLAVACGLEPYQVETALSLGEMLAKEAGFGTMLTKGLSKVKGLGRSLATAPATKRLTQAAGQTTEQIGKKPFSWRKAALTAGGLAAVGGGVYAGAKGIQKAQDMSLHPHAPARIGRSRQTMPAGGSRATSGGWY